MEIKNTERRDKMFFRKNYKEVKKEDGGIRYVSYKRYNEVRDLAKAIKKELDKEYLYVMEEDKYKTAVLLRYVLDTIRFSKLEK